MPRRMSRCCTCLSLCKASGAAFLPRIRDTEKIINGVCTVVLWVETRVRCTGEACGSEYVRRSRNHGERRFNVGGRRDLRVRRPKTELARKGASGWCRSRSKGRHFISWSRKIETCELVASKLSGMLERVQLASWDNFGIVRHRYIGICSTWRMAINVGWLLAIRRRDCCHRRTSNGPTSVNAWCAKSCKAHWQIHSKYGRSTYLLNN